MKSGARTLRCALFGLAAGILASLLHCSGALERFESAAADWRFAAAADESRWPGEVAVVYIDQQSLEEAERDFGLTWPWPRSVYGEITAYLHACGARTVLLDLVFTEKSRDPEEDERLAGAVRDLGCLYIGTPSGEKGVKIPLHDPNLKRYSIPTENAGALPEIVKLTTPAPVIAAAVAGTGLVETTSDPDGVVRRYRLAARYGEHVLPSLALTAYLHDRPRRMSVEAGGITLGDRKVPIDAKGTTLLSPYGAEPFAPYRIYALMNLAGQWEGTGDPPGAEWFRGKHVFIGASATGIKDIRATSLHRARPGVDIHATMLANIINGDLRSRSGPAPALLWALLLSCAVGCAAGFRLAVSVPAGLGLVGASVVLNVILFTSAMAWVDVTTPVLGALFAFGAVLAYNVLVEGRQRRQIKRTFQQYVAPAVVDKILDRAGTLNLDGERKYLTIFFLDFEGFTSASEKLEPHVLVDFLNRYHNEAVEEVFREEGTLDKFIGDAIMAFWGDPIDQPDQAARACRAAVRTQDRLASMADTISDAGGLRLRARIGINSGFVTVGNMGSAHQWNYTVIGDEVNLASRLEGVNKTLGTRILISQSTREKAGDAVEVREIGKIRVKGREAAVPVYEVLGLRGKVPAERLERARAFEKALAAWRERRWDEAEEGLSKLADSDPAAAFYVELCCRHRENPPPDDWEGEYTMEKK